MLQGQLYAPHVKQWLMLWLKYVLVLWRRPRTSLFWESGPLWRELCFLLSCFSSPVNLALPVKHYAFLERSGAASIAVCEGVFCRRGKSGVRVSSHEDTQVLCFLFAFLAVCQHSILMKLLGQVVQGTWTFMGFHGR